MLHAALSAEILQQMANMAVVIHLPYLNLAKDSPASGLRKRIPSICVQLCNTIKGLLNQFELGSSILIFEACPEPVEWIRDFGRMDKVELSHLWVIDAIETKGKILLQIIKSASTS